MTHVFFLGDPLWKRIDCAGRAALSLGHLICTCQSKPLSSPYSLRHIPFNIPSHQLRKVINHTLLRLWTSCARSLATVCDLFRLGSVFAASSQRKTRRPGDLHLRLVLSVSEASACPPTLVFATLTPITISPTQTTRCNHDNLYSPNPNSFTRRQPAFCLRATLTSLPHHHPTVSPIFARLNSTQR